MVTLLLIGSSSNWLLSVVSSTPTGVLLNLRFFANASSVSICFAASFVMAVSSASASLVEPEPAVSTRNFHKFKWTMEYAFCVI